MATKSRRKQGPVDWPAEWGNERGPWIVYVAGVIFIVIALAGILALVTEPGLGTAFFAAFGIVLTLLMVVPRKGRSRHFPDHGLAVVDLDHRSGATEVISSGATDTDKLRGTEIDYSGRSHAANVVIGLVAIVVAPFAFHMFGPIFGAVAAVLMCGWGVFWLWQALVGLRGARRTKVVVCPEGVWFNNPLRATFAEWSAIGAIVPVNISRANYIAIVPAAGRPLPDIRLSRYPWPPKLLKPGGILALPAATFVIDGAVLLLLLQASLDLPEKRGNLTTTGWIDSIRETYSGWQEQPS